MFPFFWPTEVKFPGSEGNYQTISPLSGWFSNTVTYKGSPEIEARITSEVASAGRQIGILTDALLELAGDDKGEALDRLRDIRDRIEAIKQRTRAELRTDARASLDKLAEKDPAGARMLAEQVLKSLEEKDAAE